jgi:predicted permease
VQVSLSLVLLIVAGMLIRSSLNALHSPTGYDNRQVIFLGAGFTRASEYTDAHRLTLIRELRSRLAALPGVAAITSARPPAATQRFETVAVPLNERSGGDPSTQSMLGYTYVEANYFQTLGIPILLGRGFQPQGREPEQSVILSESAANELWPNQNPIGRSLRLGPTDEQRRRRRSEMAADGPAYQVVGVARDKRVGEFNSSLSDEIYLPLRESQLSSRPILIRVEADPAQVRRAIDPMTSSIDPNMWSISATLEEMLRLSGSFLVSIFAATVATTVGSFALLLAVIGIYGTVSYVVVLRTREVGIRMAIGAQRSDVLGLILGETARPVLVGLLFGMLLAVGVSYLGRGWFYGIDGVDGISLAGVSSLFLAVALLASYLPARRALCVDPMVTLRSE